MRQTSLRFRALLPGMAIAAMLAASLPLLPAARGDTSVWEVSNGDNRLYLAGTVHVLRQSDYPLPAEFAQAYAAADEIYFEVDLNELLDPAFQASFRQMSSYSDGRSLRSVLSEDVYAEFYALAGRFGIPPGALDNFKPELATNMVLFPELENLGFSPQGVEMHFLEQATRDGLTQGALETAEFQASLLAGLGEGNEEAMVVAFLQEMEALEDLMDEAVSAWRAGDIDRFDELVLADMAARFPEDYAALVTRRNRDWLPQIMAMLEDADIEFVLVGVGHMPREHGLLELLRREGAILRPVASQDI